MKKKAGRLIVLTPELESNLLNELQELDYAQDFSGLVKVIAAKNKTAVVFYGEGDPNKYPSSMVIMAFQVGSDDSLFASMATFVVPLSAEPPDWREVLDNAVFDPVLARQMPKYKPFLRDIFGNRISRIVRSFLGGFSR